MKALLIIPLFIVLILGFVDELAGIAEDTINKTIMFAEDSNNALDCAFKGIDISLCSPNLMDISVKKEFNDLNEGLNALNNSISSYVAS